MRWPALSLVALISVTAGGSACADLFTADPRITAQGFSPDTALQGEAGHFRSVRVRIEAPSRIAKLLVSDDGVETDLANTSDRSLFALFGLQKRPMNAVDVTLDFVPYINSRLTQPATYRIDITVVDRKGGTAHSTLTVIVIGTGREAINDGSQTQLPKRLQESMLTLRREGSGAVEPVAATPFTWVTREAVDVTIRLRAADAGAELRQVHASGWGSVSTRESLARLLADTPAVPYVDIPAARNGAAGTVIAISAGGDDSLVYLSGSSTSFSSLGTTVTLTASIRN